MHSARCLKLSFGAMRPKSSMNTTGSTARFYGSSSSSNSTSEEIKWMMPATDSMKYFTAGHKHAAKFANISCILSCAQPLTPELFREALRHQWREFLTIRTGMKMRDGQMWCFEKPEFDIDFKMGNMDAEAEAMALLNNFKRLEDHKMYTRVEKLGKDIPCPVAELQDKFPHQYKIANVFTHGLADASSDFAIYGHLVLILNAMLDGKPIKKMNAYPFSTFDEVYKLKDTIKKELEADPTQLQKLKKEVDSFDKFPMLHEVYPRPNPIIQENRHVNFDFDSNAVKRFQQKCKAEGVTFNSAVEGVVCLAYVDLLRDAGLPDQVYQLSTNQTVNVRHYMPKSKVFPMGCHRTVLARMVEMQKDPRLNFWSIVKGINENMHSAIKSALPLRQEIVRTLTRPSIDYDDFFASNPGPIRDLGVSNVGDVTNFIDHSGAHVQATHFGSISSCIRDIYTNLFYMASYRGRTYGSFEYASDYISEELAAKYIYKFQSNFKQLGDQLL